MDATLVIYTGADTPNIPLPANTNLEVALQLIDAALAAGSSAPDYSGYSLDCVTQVDGITHPTNTRNFAEGISKILCDLKTAYEAFIAGQYASDIGTLTTAVTNLQDPGYTYVPFGIINTDGINAVWTKVFTGLDDILAAADNSGASWITLGISPVDTSMNAGFNSLIGYLATLATTVAGKQASLGTFDQTAIGEGATETPIDAIDNLTAYAASLPTFDAGSITATCVSTGTTLETWVQNICNSIDTLATNAVTSDGAGLVLGPANGCNGKSLRIDTAWDGIYKVMTDALDPSPDFLAAKLISSDGSLKISNTGSTMDLIVRDPADGKVLVNSLDPIADYLQSKLVSGSSPFGFTIQMSPNSDNTKLVLTPYMDMDAFWPALAEFISGDADSLNKFCALVAQCTGCSTCTGPTLLIAVRNALTIDLTWAINPLATSQIVKYRPKGSVMWLTSPYLSPANPQTNVATAATLTTINTNTIYQFQVDAICEGIPGSSDITESIVFEDSGFTQVGGVGSINVALPPRTTISTVEYVVKDQNLSTVATASTTGISPAYTFTGLPVGSYTVDYRLGTPINAIMLYSDDVSQDAAWYASGPVVVS